MGELAVAVGTVGIGLAVFLPQQLQLHVGALQLGVDGAPVRHTLMRGMCRSPIEARVEGRVVQGEEFGGIAAEGGDIAPVATDGVEGNPHLPADRAIAERRAEDQLDGGT